MIDAFKIGVTIAMSSNGGVVVAELVRAMTGLRVATSEVERNLGRMKTLAIGVAGVFAGMATLKGIWGVVKGAEELNKELQRTKQLGGDFATQINATRTAAIQATFSSPTTTPGFNVRLMREMGAVLGEPADAAKIIGEAGKIASVVSHFTGEDQETVIKNLIRVADARAKIFSVGADGKEHADMNKLTAELEAAAKGLILGGNYMKSGDLFSMAKQAGVPIKGMTIAAFYAEMVEAAIALGAARAGTAVTSLFAQLVGGQMTKTVAKRMEEAGMLKPGEWSSGKSGGVVLKPAALKRFSDIQVDPVNWLMHEGHDFISKYAKKQGISEVAAVFQLFGRQTTQRLVSEVISATPQFERAKEIYGQVPDIQAQYKTLMSEDLSMNLEALTKAWKGFVEVLGEAGIPAVITVLHTLTDAIHTLTAATAAHPDAATADLGLVTALGSLVALSGAITIFTAAIGPLVSLLGLVGGASTAVAVGAAPAVGGLGALIAAIPIAAVAGVASAVIAALGFGFLFVEVAKKNKETFDADEAKLEKYRKDQRKTDDTWGQKTYDGFDPSGRPVAPPSFVPPRSGTREGGPMPVVITNPNAIRRGFNDGLSDNFRGDPSGSPAFDYRTGHPGAAVP
jgi:hypothetical protein